MNKIAILLAVVLGYLSYYKTPKEWEKLKFEVVELKPPPSQTGPLAPNDAMEKAEILFKDDMIAPESIVIEGDTIYVSANNELIKIVKGKIVKKIFISTTKECLMHPTPSCGRPLGIRRLNKDLFIFADAVKGLSTVNFETEEIKTLIHAGKKYDGRWISFANDVDAIDEDNVVFTDATWMYDETTIIPAFVGGPATGRVYKYNIKTDTLTLLMDDMYYSNGIQIMPDKQSFIVAETLTARIQRHYFSGPKKGHTEIFMDNLPGHPDNIRLSKDKKTIWIAFAMPRIRGKFEPFDQILRYPTLRKCLHNYIPHKLLTWFFEYMQDPKIYGLAVEADLEGNIRRSFHSPKGIVNNLSQVCKSILEFPAMYTFENPRIQDFSIPSGTIYYITHRPTTSPKGIENLQQTCKYFFAKSKILVCSDGRFSDILVWPSMWPNSNSKPKIFEDTKFNGKFWFTGQAHIFGFNNPKRCSYLTKFIYQSNLRHLQLRDLILSIQDLDVLVKDSKLLRMNLHFTDILDSSEHHKIGFDKILEKLPYIDYFMYTANQNSEMLSNKILQNLLDLTFHHKIRKVHWENMKIPSNFDRNLFFKFIQKTANVDSTFIFEMHFEIPGHENQVNEAAKEILAKWEPSQKPRCFIFKKFDYFFF